MTDSPGEAERKLRRREVAALERIAEAMEARNAKISDRVPAPVLKMVPQRPENDSGESELRERLVDWLRDYDVAMDALGVPDRGPERHEGREMLHALADLVDAGAVPPAESGGDVDVDAVTKGGQLATAHTCWRYLPTHWGLENAPTCPRCRELAIEAGHTPSEIDELGEIGRRRRQELGLANGPHPPARPDVEQLLHIATSGQVEAPVSPYEAAALCRWVLHLEAARAKDDAGPGTYWSETLERYVRPRDDEWSAVELEKLTGEKWTEADYRQAIAEEDQLTDVQRAARVAYWKITVRTSPEERPRYIRGFEDGVGWARARACEQTIPTIDLRTRRQFSYEWKADRDPSSILSLGQARIVTNSQRQVRMLHAALTSGGREDDLLRASFCDIVEGLEIEQPWLGSLVWVTESQLDLVFKSVSQAGHHQLADLIEAHCVNHPTLRARKSCVDES